VVFSYFSRLTAAQQRVYRKSDAVTSLPLPHAAALHPLTAGLHQALERDDRRTVEEICRTVAAEIAASLHAPPVRVRVLAVRPSATWGELHGLYEGAEGRSPALITLWMRTAKHRRVVAFRSFLRTLLHELCHHADYEVFRFPDSFHTQGFYQRESSLFHQVVPEDMRGPARDRRGKESEPRRNGT
jgi:hypothetical protein